MPYPETSVSSGGDAIEATRPKASAIGQSMGDTPAISEGPALVWPDSFPTDCTQALERAARSGKHAIIYRPDGSIRPLSYADLHDSALQLLAGLQHSGLVPGSVLLVASNDAEVFLTGLWAGILGGLHVSAIELPDAQADSSAWQRFEATCTLLDHPVVLLDAAGKQQRAHVSALKACQAITPHDFHDGTYPPVQIHAPGPDDTALIILTSGSTGVPKGVMQSHRALLAMAAALLVDACHAGANDTLMNWLPRDHVGAMAFIFMGAIILQANQVHADAGYVLGQPERWLKIVEAQRVSITWSPNFAYELLARAARASASRHDLGSLRAIFNGGEAVNEQALLSSVHDLEQHGLRPSAMIPAFGMSETCAGISKGRLGNTVGAFTSLGRPVAGSRLRIVNDQNALLTEGEIGNIHVQSPQLFSGYFGPEAPAPRVADTDWFDTGDAGFMANGELYVTGRIKDTLNVRGVTLFAHELENTLARIEGIDPARMAVTPVLLAGAGTEEIAVFFSTWPEADLHDDNRLSTLIADIHDGLRTAHAVATHYLVPLPQSAFPLTPVGKIIKKDLRHRLETGLFTAELDRSQRLGKLAIKKTHPRTGPAFDPAAPCIAAFMAQILEHPGLDADDDFFLAGGDSISASRLAAELSEWFFTEIPAATIFQHTTADTLARYLRAHVGEPELFETVVKHLNDALSRPGN